MAINIKDSKTDSLAREVAKRAGETITVAVRNALQERLQRLVGLSAAPTKLDRLYEILNRVDALPKLDSRIDDEILGYENGIFR